MILIKAFFILDETSLGVRTSQRGQTIFLYKK